MTKATYDAIGDHFRSLWGKEAGWAHSVLFTADLRAFSERLPIKVEVKEEEGAGTSIETITKVEKVLATAIKREFEAESIVFKAEEHQISRKSKRRKQG